MTAYTDTLNSLGPRALWPLDDSSGTTATEVADSAPGTYSGTFTLNQTGPSASVPSVLLNGGHVTMPQVVDWGGPLITVALWWKKSALQAADGIIWSVGLAGVNGFNLQRDNADGKLYFGEPAVARYYLNTIVNDNNWHFLAIVAEGATPIKLYMDGGLRGSVNPAASVATTTAVTLGSASDGTSAMKGNYAEFGIYRYPFTADLVSGALLALTTNNNGLPATNQQLVTAQATLDAILAAVRKTYS